MTDDILEPRLGAGKIIAESFSLLFRNVGSLVLLCFPIYVCGLFISDLLNDLLVLESRNILNGALYSYYFNITMESSAFFVKTLLTYGVVTALITQLGYDVKLDRPCKFKNYFMRTFETLFQNLTLSIASLILIIAGLLAFVLPGLWLSAVFAVFIPALIIERVGFGALKRSIDLTKNYRWPIVGILVLVQICETLIDMAGEKLSTVIALNFQLGGIFVTPVLAFTFCISTALISIATALIYARLREIKDGIGLEDLASVFD